MSWADCSVAWYASAQYLGVLCGGLYAWIVLGVLGVIKAAEADPFDGGALALGIIWIVFLAKLTAALGGLVVFLIGVAIICAFDGTRPSFRLRRRRKSFR